MLSRRQPRLMQYSHLFVANSIFNACFLTVSLSLRIEEEETQAACFIPTNFGQMNFGTVMKFTLSSIIDESLARNKFSLYRPWTSFHFQQLFIKGNGDQNIKTLRKFLDHLVANLYKVYCLHVTLKKDRKEDTMDKSTIRGNKANKRLHRAIWTILDKFFISFRVLVLFVRYHVHTVV